MAQFKTGAASQEFSTCIQDFLRLPFDIGFLIINLVDFYPLP
jgi:hypothetical protein